MILLIYSLIGCPYSKKALNILKDSKLKYNVIHVKNKDKDEFKIKLKINTFPQIYIQKDVVYNKSIKNILIGGCDELEKYVYVLKFINENDLNLNKLIEFNKLFNQN